MAEFRQLHTRLWTDSWFSALNKEQKLLFIYLFSNDVASVCGMYELPVRKISFDTGLTRDEVRATLEIFIAAAKIHYDYKVEVVWVCNMLKYQGSSSPKLQTRIEADIKAVPDCDLKRMFFDTVWIPYRQGRDTPVSVSVSVSSESVLEEGMQGGKPFTAAETATAIASFGNNGAQACARLYQKVTGQVCIPPTQTADALPSLQAVIDASHGEPDIEQGKRVFAEWCSTQSKSTGRTYSKLNTAWLKHWLEQLAPVPEATHGINQQTDLERALARIAAGVRGE